MTEFFLQQTAGAGAPDVEDDIYDGTFDGVVPEQHDDWKTEADNFGHPDNGARWRFNFSLYDTDGSALYDEGDPLVVSTLTKPSMHKKSNGYAIMKGVLTASELAVVDAGEKLDIAPIIGRKVQVQIKHNASGWPFVAQVLPARKRGAK